MGLPKVFYEKMIFGYFQVRFKTLIFKYLKNVDFDAEKNLRQIKPMFTGVPSRFDANLLECETFKFI